MKKERVFVIILLLFILVSTAILISFFKWKSANVIIDTSDSFKVYQKGDSLEGNIILSLEKSDFLRKETPILVSLSKGDNVLSAKTLTLEEFISLSGKNPNIIEKEGTDYYTEGDYEVDINKIIDYSFSESGEYELFFSLLELDFNVNREIIVK